jgi:serine/threonine-protein kinase
VHRDYKPENVLVDAEGTSKLTDFGVAARVGQGAPAGGTPLYMAPEQWDGTPASPAADIYAATAVFFECLTGRTPFSGGLGQLAAQHAAAEVPVGLVDEPLRALIARGMAKDPAARPASATELMSELEATAAAYGPDWEERGRAQLAGRAAALLLLLLHAPAAATAGGTGTTTVTTTLAPKAAVASHASLSGWQVAAVSVAVFGVVAGAVVGVGRLASSGHPATMPAGVATTTRTASARPTTPAPQPGLTTVDDAGRPLDPRILPLAREVLTDARNHDAAALDRLLDPTSSVSAVNKVLAQPGAYQEIITLLTRTHGAQQDGSTEWPGFLLAGTSGGLDAADAKVLGVTSIQDYKGIRIGIGDGYTAKPYVPRLVISQSP